MTRWITTSDGFELAVREYGAVGNPVLVAVHGYPDNQTLWDQVVAVLATRFRVVTYDVRGAGESDRPRSRAAYRLDRLADDLATVLHEISPDRPVHVLAHDWGSIQGWHAVTDPRWSDRIASYTSISGPCLEHVGEWIRDRWRHPSPRRSLQLLAQLMLSGYIGFFRLPRLPEMAWTSGFLPRLIDVLQRLDSSASRGRPKVVDGIHGLQLYRANMLPSAPRREARATGIPVQVLAPTGDRFVSASLQTDIANWASDLRVRHVAGGHWLPRTRPSVVARYAAELIDEVESA